MAEIAALFAELHRLYDAATTGSSWYWDSYSQILTVVPTGHVMDDSDGGEPGYARIAKVYQAPKDEGHGDELHHTEPRANAQLIVALVNAWPKIADLAERAKRLQVDLHEIRAQQKEDFERAKRLEEALRTVLIGAIILDC